jgi:hypothetical protein
MTLYPRTTAFTADVSSQCITTSKGVTNCTTQRIASNETITQAPATVLHEMRTFLALFAAEPGLVSLPNVCAKLPGCVKASWRALWAKSFVNMIPAKARSRYNVVLTVKTDQHARSIC